MTPCSVLTGREALLSLAASYFLRIAIRLLANSRHPIDPYRDDVIRLCSNQRARGIFRRRLTQRSTIYSKSFWRPSGRYGSNATELRCPRWVRSSLNLRHDVAAPRTTLRAKTGHSCQLCSSRIAQQTFRSHAACDGCHAIEWRCGSPRARPICEAALANLKAPLRPVPVPADPTDVSEEREASGPRRILLYGNRRTTARPARSS